MNRKETIRVNKNLSRRRKRNLSKRRKRTFKKAMRRVRSKRGGGPRSYHIPRNSRGTEKLVSFENKANGTFRFGGRIYNLSSEDLEKTEAFYDRCYKMAWDGLPLDINSETNPEDTPRRTRSLITDVREGDPALIKVKDIERGLGMKVDSDKPYVIGIIKKDENGPHGGIVAQTELPYIVDTSLLDIGAGCGFGRSQNCTRNNWKIKVYSGLIKHKDFRNGTLTMEFRIIERSYRRIRALSDERKELGYPNLDGFNDPKTGWRTLRVKKRMRDRMEAIRKFIKALVDEKRDGYAHPSNEGDAEEKEVWKFFNR